MKSFKKLLACMLVLALIFSAVPLSAAAETVIDSSAAVSSAETVTEIEPEILYEITEKRDANTKHFAMSDGTVKACIYPQAVHYEKSGEFLEIDNTLTQTQTDGKTYYQNTANSFKAKLPKSSGDYIEFSDENGYVKFRLIDALGKSIEKDENISASSVAEEDITAVKNNFSRAVYKSVKADVDIEYDIIGNMLKETIVLNKKSDRSYAFEILTSAASAVKNNDNSVSFYNSEGVEIYTIASPYMVDAEGEYSNSVTAALTAVKTGYVLVYTPDYGWLSAEERAYPVRIDPTLFTNFDSVNSFDTFVFTNQTASEERGDFDVINVGKRTSGLIQRGFIKFNIPSEIGKNDCIVDAKLLLTHYTAATSTSGIQVDVHELTQGFNEIGTYWSNQPGFDPPITDYSIVKGGNYSFTASDNKVYTYDSYNLTSLVSKWHRGDATNNGIILKLHNESEALSSDKEVYYFSKNSLYYKYISKFVEITYRNTTGLEDYWSYTTQSLGRYGTGYVNNYNGNLVYVHNDVSFASLINGFTLSHVYNSNLSGNGEGRYGNGWRLNLVQKFEADTVDGNSAVKFVYTDGDGTKHYFVQTDDGTIKDEDGLGLTYQEYNTGEFRSKITDKDGNVMIFDYLNYLRRIIDTNGNTINLNYSPIPGVDNYLSTITTSSGGAIGLNYDSNYKLVSITDNASRITYFNRDSNGNLASIVYPDGTNLSLGYSDKKLCSITMPDSTKQSYSYYPNLRVSAENYKSAADVMADQLCFYYSHNQTDIVDLQNRKTTYQFDTVGRVTCVYDNNQNVYSQSYTATSTASNGIFKNNKLATESNGAVYVNNLITNPVFSSGLSSWTNYIEESCGTISAVTDQSLLTSNSIKITNTEPLISAIMQLVSVASGKTYTLSAYIKTDNVVSSSHGAGIEVVTSTGRILHSEYISDTTDTSVDNGFVKVSCTFTLAADETINRITAGLYYATGTVYIDSIQLEEGDTANPINLVSNSGIEINSGNASTPSYFTANFSANTSGCTNSDKQAGSYSLRIYGDNSTKHYKQIITTSGKSGDVYSFGAWTKAYSVPYENNVDPYKMVCEFNYSDGTTGRETISFNTHITDWQFAVKNIVAKKDYISVTVFLCYNYNCNFALYDSIFLYRDTMQSYTYDENGNVVSTADYAKQQSSFEFTDNYLSKLIEPDGSSYEYTYDSEKNLTDAVSSNGIKYHMTYDGSGNVLSAETTSTENTEADKITSSATYQNNGNFADTVTDSCGNTTSYDYNTSTGTLSSVEDAKGNTVSYTYNSLNDRLKSVASGNSTVNYTYKTNGSIDTVSSPSGTLYSFGYDEFGRQDTVSVGSQVLSDITYKNNYTSLISRFDYGNGDYKTYTYDNYDRLLTESVNGVQTLSHTYDKSGNTAEVADLLRSVTTKFAYDLIGRITSIKSSDGQQMNYVYDSLNRVSLQKWSLSNISLTTEYIYGSSDIEGQKDGLIYGVKLNGTRKLSYAYDELSRLDTRTLATTTPFVTEYTYLEGANEGTTTTLVKTVKNGADTLEYAYDAVGNITEVKLNGEVTESYTYDSLNQLSTATYGGNTYTYTYDNGGNITSVKKDGTVIKSYTYGNSEWKDLLTSYSYSNSSGTTTYSYGFTYDEIGNPLSYNGATLVWQGRQLQSLTRYNSPIYYSYNAEGKITQINANNNFHQNYYWLGDTLTHLTLGDGYYMSFLYDESGTPYGFKCNHTGDGGIYFYVYNLQGDVTGIIDSSGNYVVKYTYDPWGKCTTTYDTTISIGNLNPFRYRGYIYDHIGGFYYLQSRFYDPNTGRFLNADGQLNDDILGNNLFSYCGNNPINRIDPNGKAWYHWLIGAGVVAACAVATVITAGGAIPAIAAVGAVSCGVAASSTAATVAAGAFIASSVTYTALAIDAAYNSKTTKDFANQGSWGTVASVVGSAVIGGISSYSPKRKSSSKSSTSPISKSDATRIQNAANKTHQKITVIGSRANGTAGLESDWDYIMSGNSAQRHSAITSVPRGICGGENNMGIDIFSSYPGSPNSVMLDKSKPYIEFFPE